MKCFKYDVESTEKFYIYKNHENMHIIIIIIITSVRICNIENVNVDTFLDGIIQHKRKIENVVI